MNELVSITGAHRRSMLSLASPAAPPIPPPPRVPQLPRPPRIGRRPALLGSLAAIVVGVGIEAATSRGPDAELLVLADEFIDLTQRMKGLFGEGEYAAAHVPDDNTRRPLEDAIYRRQLEIQNRLADLRAKTPAGLVARVRMADAYGAEWREEIETTNLGEAIAFDLAEDVLAMFGRGRAA